MKKNTKGMTLVEIIVALALFAIMGLMIASVFSATANLNRMTNVMNQKMDMQIALANIYNSDSNDLITPFPKGLKLTFNKEDSETHSRETKVDIKMIELEKNKTSTGDPKEKVNTNIKYFGKN